ncbi:MAG: ABC transporter ATP-binding protein [Methanosphaera sp.]|nr:ABC transporter ATP-binding protein [Methanosphaera sp.]
MSKLLEVEKLSISFSQYFNGLEQRELKVLSDLTIDVDDHEILAVLGISGSGKSFLAHAILGILQTNAKVSGNIRYKGKQMDDELKEKLRGDKISFIPQSVNNLNPLMKVKEQAIGYIEDEDEKEQVLKKQREIFSQYDLSEEVDEMYPFQLSGGMARKVLISTALLNDPEIIIADEPTPGLDEKAVEETINNLIELKERGIGMILITHDIHTAIETSDRIAILYLGYVIEITDTKNFSGTGEKLLHPYTRSLYRALPETEFELTEGHQPSYLHIPKGCPYHENCPHQVRECHYEIPELREVNGTVIRCFNPLVDGD